MVGLQRSYDFDMGAERSRTHVQFNSIQYPDTTLEGYSEIISSLNVHTVKLDKF